MAAILTVTILCTCSHDGDGAGILITLDANLQVRVELHQARVCDTKEAQLIQSITCIAAIHVTKKLVNMKGTQKGDKG